MADNEYDDEYQFDDLDKSVNEHEEKLDSQPSTQAKQDSTNIRRNALIVAGLFVLLLLGYKFIGSFFSAKKTPQAIPSLPVTDLKPAPITAVAPVPQPQEPPVQTTSPVVPQPSTDNTIINQKLSAFEANQQDLRQDLNTVNSKLGTVTTTVNDLTEKIAQLSQLMTELNAKLDKQSQEIVLLTERTKPKLVKRKVVVKTAPRLLYFIQAIIPGRAWLIATNGSTLTVREGTRIAGWGVVKLIDPIQGRVLMSTGQVIRFSQQDS